MRLYACTPTSSHELTPLNALPTSSEAFHQSSLLSGRNLLVSASYSVGSISLDHPMTGMGPTSIGLCYSAPSHTVQAAVESSLGLRANQLRH